MPTFLDQVFGNPVMQAAVQPFQQIGDAWSQNAARQRALKPGDIVGGLKQTAAFPGLVANTAGLGAQGLVNLMDPVGAYTRKQAEDALVRHIGAENAAKLHHVLNTALMAMGPEAGEVGMGAELRPPGDYIGPMLPRRGPPPPAEAPTIRQPVEPEGPVMRAGPDTLPQPGSTVSYSNAKAALAHDAARPESAANDPISQTHIDNAKVFLRNHDAERAFAQLPPGELERATEAGRQVAREHIRRAQVTGEVPSSHQIAEDWERTYKKLAQTPRREPFGAKTIINPREPPTVPAGGGGPHPPEPPEPPKPTADVRKFPTEKRAARVAADRAKAEAAKMPVWSGFHEPPTSHEFSTADIMTQEEVARTRETRKVTPANDIASFRNARELMRSGNPVEALGQMHPDHRINALDSLDAILADPDLAGHVADDPLAHDLGESIQEHHIVSSPLYKGARKLSDTQKRLTDRVRALNAKYPNEMHQIWAGWEHDMGENTRLEARDRNPNRPSSIQIDRGSPGEPAKAANVRDPSSRMRLFPAFSKMRSGDVAGAFEHLPTGDHAEAGEAFHDAVAKVESTMPGSKGNAIVKRIGGLFDEYGRSLTGKEAMKSDTVVKQLRKSIRDLEKEYPDIAHAIWNHWDTVMSHHMADKYR